MQCILLKSWPVLQCICPNSPCESAVFQLLPDRILPNKLMLLCSMQKEFVHLPVRIPQLINIQLGGLRVYVMDGCRWGVWQLINALIISSEDLPLLPELTEWAVCGLTSNAVFRARPLLSALPGSHSFSSQRKMCTFCTGKVYNGDETVRQGVLGSLPLQWVRGTSFQYSLLTCGPSSGLSLCMQNGSCLNAQHILNIKKI